MMCRACQLGMGHITLVRGTCSREWTSTPPNHGAYEKPVVLSQGTFQGLSLDSFQVAGDNLLVLLEAVDGEAELCTHIFTQ